MYEEKRNNCEVRWILVHQGQAAKMGTKLQQPGECFADCIDLQMRAHSYPSAIRTIDYVFVVSTLHVDMSF